MIGVEISKLVYKNNEQYPYIITWMKELNIKKINLVDLESDETIGSVNSIYQIKTLNTYDDGSKW